MKPGDSITHHGVEVYVEQMELRGFGEAAAVWARLTKHDGEGKERKLTHAAWVKVSEITSDPAPGSVSGEELR